MGRYRYAGTNGEKMSEHKLVWESAHGPVPPGHVIHHIDGNGRNNDLSNLQLMTIGEHNALHARLRRECKDVIDSNDPEVIEFRKKMRISSARFHAKHKEKENARTRKYRREHYDAVIQREREYSATHRDVRERYRREHHDELLLKDRAYKEAHRDIIREKSRKHYHEHKEECSVRAKEYRLSHPEYFKRVNAAYHQAHKEEISTRKSLAYWKKKGTNPNLVQELESKLASLKQARLASKSESSADTKHYK